MLLCNTMFSHRHRLHSPRQRNRQFWIEPGRQQEFIIGKGRQRLLALRHFIARNIYNLLHRSIVEETLDDAEFNCHSTAGIALGECHVPTWAVASYRGTPLTMEDALATLPLPCGMQIHDSTECQTVLHGAVCLGIGCDGTPIAFQKNGISPMEILPLQDVTDEYRDIYKQCVYSFYHRCVE